MSFRQNQRSFRSFKTYVVIWLYIVLLKPMVGYLGYLWAAQRTPAGPGVQAYTRRVSDRLFLISAFVLFLLVAVSGPLPDSYLEHRRYPLFIGWYYLTFIVLSLVAGYRWLGPIIASAAVLVGGGVAWWLSGFAPAHISRGLLVVSVVALSLAIGGWSWLDNMRSRDGKTGPAGPRGE